MANTIRVSGKYHDSDAFYRFGYKVNASETGDMRQHIEARFRNKVKCLRATHFVAETKWFESSQASTHIVNVNEFNAIVRQRHRYGLKYSLNYSSPNV